eukprot:9948156-Karenia_brevis.AAC.1
MFKCQVLEELPDLLNLILSGCPMDMGSPQSLQLLLHHPFCAGASDSFLGVPIKCCQVLFGYPPSVSPPWHDSLPVQGSPPRPW